MDTRVTITLEYPVDANGESTDALHMRRPTVRDMIAAEKTTKGSDAEREITLFANLCDVAPETIMNMDMKDYAAMQKVYTGFLS